MGLYVGWLGILLATIAANLIGFLWYSDLLFGKQWQRMNGFNAKEIKKAKAKGMKGMTRPLVVNFVAIILMAYVLSLMFQYLGVLSMVGALKTAFLLWAGFIVPIQLSPVLWEGKSVGLYVLNIGYNLVSMLAMAALIFAF